VSAVVVGAGGAVESVRTVREALLGATGPVAIVAADLVIPPAALAPIVDDPFAGTALLVRPGGAAANVRVRHHVVTSVGGEFHDVAAPDHTSVGALVVGAADVPAALARVDSLAAALGDGSVTSTGADAVELLAVALVRGGIGVRAVGLVDVPWFRGPEDPAAAAAAVAAVPADRIRQLQANRVDDGFYSTFVVRRLSKPLTRVALRLGWSPNAVTLVSFAVGLLAAAFFAVGSWWALLVGAILLQASLVIDCVDGEVARATRRFTALGAWLDASTDRVKEFLAYAGLAFGAARFGIDIWWLAVVLVVLQTTRHMTDYDFSRVQRLREAHVPERDLRLADDGAAGATGGWSVSGAMEMSTRMNRRDAVRWFKRAIHLPIGERWLIISVVAVVLGAQWALAVLLVGGLLALGYVVAGRTLRTLTWRGQTPAAGISILRAQGDSGPILTLLLLPVSTPARERWWGNRAAWAVPALLRLLELGVIALVALLWHPPVVIIAFWLMVVVAFHHYDTLYRALQGAAPPRWLVWLGLGWEGRTAAVVVLAALGESVLGVGLAWGASLLAVLFVVVASVQWLSEQSRSGRKASA
jgi:phosphatidylglycerophosphate synthase